MVSAATNPISNSPEQDKGFLACSVAAGNSKSFYLPKAPIPEAKNGAVAKNLHFTATEGSKEHDVMIFDLERNGTIKTKICFDKTSMPADLSSVLESQLSEQDQALIAKSGGLAKVQNISRREIPGVDQTIYCLEFLAKNGDSFVTWFTRPESPKIKTGIERSGGPYTSLDTKLYSVQTQTEQSITNNDLPCDVPEPEKLQSAIFSYTTKRWGVDALITKAKDGEHSILFSSTRELIPLVPFLASRATSLSAEKRDALTQIEEVTGLKVLVSPTGSPLFQLHATLKDGSKCLLSFNGPDKPNSKLDLELVSTTANKPESDPAIPEAIPLAPTTGKDSRPRFRWPNALVATAAAGAILLTAQKVGDQSVFDYQTPSVATDPDRTPESDGSEIEIATPEAKPAEPTIPEDAPAETTPVAPEAESKPVESVELMGPPAPKEHEATPPQELFDQDPEPTVATERQRLIKEFEERMERVKERIEHFREELARNAQRVAERKALEDQPTSAHVEPSIPAAPETPDSGVADSEGATSQEPVEHEPQLATPPDEQFLSPAEDSAQELQPDSQVEPVTRPEPEQTTPSTEDQSGPEPTESADAPSEAELDRIVAGQDIEESPTVHPEEAEGKDESETAANDTRHREYLRNLAEQLELVRAKARESIARVIETTRQLAEQQLEAEDLALAEQSQPELLEPHTERTTPADETPPKVMILEPPVPTVTETEEPTAIAQETAPAESSETEISEPPTTQRTPQELARQFLGERLYDGAREAIARSIELRSRLEEVLAGAQSKAQAATLEEDKPEELDPRRLTESVPSEVVLLPERDAFFDDPALEPGTTGVTREDFTEEPQPTISHRDLLAELSRDDFVDPAQRQRQEFNGLIDSLTRADFLPLGEETKDSPPVTPEVAGGKSKKQEPGAALANLQVERHDFQDSPEPKALSRNDFVDHGLNSPQPKMVPLPTRKDFFDHRPMRYQALIAELRRENFSDNEEPSSVTALRSDPK